MATTLDPSAHAHAAPALRVEATNNFDLLRLLASFQVVYFHAVWHLRIGFGDAGKAFNHVFDFFPGVPIFFVISGFLISKSYERSSSLRSYARNRFLRIYPALWVSFAASLALLGVVGLLGAAFVATPQFAAWVVAQLTFAQVYSPAHLRQFGIGTLNGSLWTIPVELGFYVAVPIVYLALRRLSRLAGDLLLAGVALASYTIWWAATNHPGHDSVLWLKMLLVSSVPYFYMFLFGVLLHRNFARVRRLFEGKVLFWTAGYIGLMLAIDALFGPSRKTSFPLVLASHLGLAGFTMSFAFSGQWLSERVLRGNDISYGLYIYHMLVVNLFVHYGAVGRARHAVLAVALSLAVATLSWRLVESPALRLKRSARARPAPSPPAVGAAGAG